MSKHYVYTTCRRARPRRISVSEMAWSPLVLRKTNASTTDGNTIDSFLQIPHIVLQRVLPSLHPNFRAVFLL